MQPRYPKGEWSNSDGAHAFVGQVGKFDVWHERNTSFHGINYDCLVLQSSNPCWWYAGYVYNLEAGECRADEKPWKEALALFREWNVDEPSVSPNAHAQAA